MIKKMSQETKKMLAIIDKQHKEAYQQIQREHKRRKLMLNVILGIFIILYILMALYYIFIF